MIFILFTNSHNCLLICLYNSGYNIWSHEGLLDQQATCYTLRLPEQQSSWQLWNYSSTCCFAEGFGKPRTINACRFLVGLAYPQGNPHTHITHTTIKNTGVFFKRWFGLRHKLSLILLKTTYIPMYSHIMVGYRVISQSSEALLQATCRASCSVSP